MKDLCKSIRWGFGLTLGYYLAETVDGIVGHIGRLMLQ
jgi:hypothetical protein